ncbi:hypothetical protein SLEP1_g49079 [Rubroshorea leprosula]|uniref:BZIP domain-containing protein n=1 Tax=Rubroshorea leprosula TaxID=152421 RepID=A0AAV5LVM7_9ROSI|nr:hypothetical protein SLEP1_g49079 [Rubroshorea leprosula]
MASSRGSGSSMMRSSSSEEDLQQIMDQRKRKRMQSNRESARRSRMRKQKHLDDLTAQVSELTRENNQILTSMNITSQLYMNLEAENSVLKVQMAELNTRLQSLNEIIDFVNSSSRVLFRDDLLQVNHESFVDPWSSAAFYANQPIMASAEMIL